MPREIAKIEPAQSRFYTPPPRLRGLGSLVFKGALYLSARSNQGNTVLGTSLGSTLQSLLTDRAISRIAAELGKELRFIRG